MLSKVLLTVLGWEDRFTEGFKKNFDNSYFQRTIVFRYLEYESQTFTSLNFIRNFCLAQKIDLIEVILQNENALFNWHSIEDSLSSFCRDDEEVTIDISTMPRDTMWSIFFVLKQRYKSLRYVYYQPENYSDEWLSREPDNPRLLYKHSGLVEFNKPTLLFIIAGFDTERTQQLINYYAPKKLVILLQSGNQFISQNEENAKHYFTDFNNVSDSTLLSVDLYNINVSFNFISQLLHTHVDDFNVIATSLGPKISALTLYKYYSLNQSIALTYVPCKEYNLQYSSGIGDSYSGTIDFSH